MSSRCAEQELESIAHRAAHAEAEFDEARIAEVDDTIAYIAREPATYARKLRSMPEGVDRLIAKLLGLREELNTGRWDWSYGDKLSHLTGSVDGRAGHPGQGALRGDQRRLPVSPNPGEGRGSRPPSGSTGPGTRWPT